MRLILCILTILLGSFILSNSVQAKTNSTWSVPILMYHHIADRKVHDPYSVSPKVFDQQMAWLKKNDYNVISYSSFYLAMALNKPLTGKNVVITFDDGDVDQYNKAYPILKKYGFSAMFYIITGYVDHKGYMTWDMIKDLEKSGMQIGGHTVNHKNLAMLDAASIQKEVVNSKKILETKLKNKIKYFAYPGGSYGASAVAELKKAGYLSAVTTKHNTVHRLDENLFLVSRIHIDDDIISFAQFVEGKRLN